MPAPTPAPPLLAEALAAGREVAPAAAAVPADVGTGRGRGALVVASIAR